MFLLMLSVFCVTNSMNVSLTEGREGGGGGGGGG